MRNLFRLGLVSVPVEQAIEQLRVRPDLTSETRKLIDLARAEGNTQLLHELLSAKALLPAAQEIADTRSSSGPVDP